VVNGASATVSAIDSSGNVTTIPISPGSGRCSGGDLPPAGFTVTTAAVSPDGARLYVLAHQTNSVAVFDTTNTPATQLGSVPVGNCPDTMTISSDGTRLYVAETGAGSVGVIDTTLIGTTAQAEIADIPVGGEPFGVTSTPDGKRLWVADELNSGVDIIDTNPNDGTKYNTVVGGFPVGRNPQLIVFSSDGTKAYISSAGDNTVYVVAN